MTKRFAYLHDYKLKFGYDSFHCQSFLFKSISPFTVDMLIDKNNEVDAIIRKSIPGQSISNYPLLRT